MKLFSEKTLRCIVCTVGILLLFAALTLTSCDSGETPTDTVKVETLSASDAVSLSGYSVIRADASDATVTSASVSLRKAIESACAVSVDLGTDWVKRGEPVPTDTAEIIVGNSNRKETDGLRSKDYRILREGNRVYLLGGSSDSVCEAVQFFTDHYLSDKGMILPDNTDYFVKGSYDIETFTLGNTALDSLRVYADDAVYAESLVSLLAQMTGMPTQRVLESEKANIVMTQKETSVPEGNWGVITKDGSITIVGRTDIEKDRAYYYFTEKLADAANTSHNFTLEVGKVSEHQRTKEEYYQMKQLVIYPEFPEAIKRDYRYTVSVTQGSQTATIPVYNHAMESSVSRGRDGMDDMRRFATFAFSGEPVRVDIRVNCDFNSYSVLPSAKNFKNEYKDGVISVWLDEPDYFVIRLDNSDNTILSVLADYPEFPDEINENAANFIKIEGWVEPEGGILKLTEPNTTVYITPGSVLNARVDIRGEGSKIIGHGAIVDPFENIYEYDISVGGTEGSGTHLLNLSGNNITADGPILLDARCFNVTVGGNNNTVRNVKILSTMMTTDGISIYWGKNDLAEHCFIYNGDNSLVFSAEGTVYRDITIGNTCAAIFPQGSPKTTLLEDIHIFRTDDGTINHIYNGSTPGTKQQSADVTINRLDTVDCVYMPHLFRGRNMGSELDKNFLLKNISLGDMSSQSTSKIIDFQNAANYLFSDNNHLTFENISIGGKICTTADELKTVVQGNPEHNTVEVKTDGNFTPVVQTINTVNYQYKTNVYIGSFRQEFQNPVIADSWLLPYDEIRSALRTDKSGTTTDKNGIAYITKDELVKSGMAKTAEVKDGKLYITPVYNKENLLLADSGEISRFTEATCYELNLITSKDDAGWIYTVENTKKTLNSGMQRAILEEIQKYGKGTYKLTFKAKGCQSGRLLAAVNFKKAERLMQIIDITDSWKEYTFTFTVTDTHVLDLMAVMTIKGHTAALDSFDLRDLVLTKVS